MGWDVCELVVVGKQSKAVEKGPAFRLLAGGTAHDGAIGQGC